MKQTICAATRQPPPLFASPLQAGRAVLQGRWLGLGLLCIFSLGIWSNFWLQEQVFAAPGFLSRAGGMPLQVVLIVMLGLLTALTGLAVAAALRGLYGEQQPLLSRCYVALVAAALATSLFEGALVLAMRSLSVAFLASGADGNAYEPARALLAGLRNGLHFPDKLLGGIGVTLMYLLLYRARAIPPLLALAGMLAGVLQWTAVARELFGLDVMHALLVPLGLVYPLTGLWLLLRGLAPRPAHG
ncbi:DUF4386 family protein [Janthinobacterium sp. GW458P]|uniref:DUF4386 family protein n=1 Tax=Janthinobacterium sp. GW458P TaxID=1981504 RepID=UPI000A3264B1|nr:DUF4386 family protein [Janthinobacterium sp. GW458P]MBE3024769.1 DUF4386 family protein [Janthinobacterium sp. GW458P]PHV17933.1 DUF4386 domain-containing protein [Janthinobacterium sp. BJB303]